MAFDRLLEQDILAVTESAAIAAAQTMGFGDRRRSDRVAVEALLSALDGIEVAGRVVIGEGDDGDDGEASGLAVGSEVGALRGKEDAPRVDIAVDPLEGSNQCATGGPGAVTVLAAAEPGGLFHAPDTYMEKLVVGPTARGSIHLDSPVPENLRNIAGAFDRAVSDLTVVVLDRPRHRQLVADIRAAGARIRLIPDGDLAASISAAVRGTGVHAVLGIGGVPEGVLTAAAIRCLGGEMQARLVALDEEQEKRLAEIGYRDLAQVYTTEDLAPGDNLIFSCTGVTDGEFLRGVRFFGGGYRTSTLFLSLASGIVRFVDTVRREDPQSPVRLL